MLAILLKILSVLGIVLLVILGILFLTLLLVLFMPIVYRFHAEKCGEQLHVNGKVRWLFGLVRVSILYPSANSVIVKFLWFTLYDSGKAVPKEAPVKQKKKEDAETSGETTEEASVHSETIVDPESNTDKEMEETSDFEETDKHPLTFKEKLFEKCEKIKYTLKKIYDKIKHIWENISFYKKLLQDSETQALVSHGWKRLKKIFRSIRPRKLKADVVFGTGSPDTTGYAYGIFGMIMPKLGKRVLITPDFNQQILEGQLDATGHIMVFTLLRHILAVLFDKRLWLLKKRLDAHQRQMKQET